MSNSSLEMNLHAEHDGDAIILRLGETALDRMNAKEFRDSATRLIENHTGPVHLDVTTMTFLDSSGVGAILHLSKALPEGAPQVKLLGVAPAVLSVLELVRVHRYFDIVPQS